MRLINGEMIICIINFSKKCTKNWNWLEKLSLMIFRMFSFGCWKCNGEKEFGTTEEKS